MEHNTVIEHERYKVTIRADKMSGWFEYDGEAIGGLIFGSIPDRTNPHAMELTDHDGTYELPRAVARILREAGIHVDSTFYSEPQS